MKKLLIWGTGYIASKMIKNKFGGEVIGFVQSNINVDTFCGKPIYTPNNVMGEYDYIVVANKFSDEIYRTCQKEKLDLQKIIFIFPLSGIEEVSNNSDIREILGEANYTLYCENRGQWKETFFEDDLKKYKALNKRDNFNIQEKYIWPIIGDKYASAGTINNYFWQDLWAARLIVNSKVQNHFDIGSRLDGFIAHLLAADINVTMIDIRKFPGEIENLETIVDDATLLQQIPNESVQSISALCSLEHFGLGRYGDPIDPEACFKCFENIQRKLCKKGRLYISVPIGKERVEFNAHRVFYAETIINCFSELKLIEFSCTANGEIEYNVDIHKYDNDYHNGEYRYGLFCFEK